MTETNTLAYFCRSEKSEHKHSTVDMSRLSSEIFFTMGIDILDKHSSLLLQEFQELKRFNNVEVWVIKFLCLPLPISSIKK